MDWSNCGEYLAVAGFIRLPNLYCRNELHFYSKDGKLLHRVVVPSQVRLDATFNIYFIILILSIIFNYLKVIVSSNINFHFFIFFGGGVICYIFTYQKLIAHCHYHSDLSSNLKLLNFSADCVLVTYISYKINVYLIPALHLPR